MRADARFPPHESERDEPPEGRDISPFYRPADRTSQLDA